MALPVVPHAGTWIEMHRVHVFRIRRKVVPHAGTWIEILKENAIDCAFDVVPHAGTWIEIEDPAAHRCTGTSFPTRERGLKCMIPTSMSET